MQNDRNFLGSIIAITDDAYRETAKMLETERLQLDDLMRSAAIPSIRISKKEKL